MYVKLASQAMVFNVKVSYACDVFHYSTAHKWMIEKLVLFPISQLLWAGDQSGSGPSKLLLVILHVSTLEGYPLSKVSLCS